MRTSVLFTFTLMMYATVAGAQWNTVAGGITYTAGNVGIGTSSPQSILHLAGANGVSALTLSTPGTDMFRIQTIPAVGSWGAETLNANYNSGWYLDDITTNGWFFKLDVRGNLSDPADNGLWLYRIPSGGNPHYNEYAVFGVSADRAFFHDPVRIGYTNPNDALLANTLLDVNGTAHVSGDLNVDGNIQAPYQDVAEWVPGNGDLRAGTVVVLDRRIPNHVLPSTRSYDITVAGVVSPNPGIVLGVASPDKARIATTGRVRVRVDASAGAINIGDLLVTGDDEGTAIRSTPVLLEGVNIHRPGTIIGKALEPLTSGRGEILVLLALQ